MTGFPRCCDRSRRRYLAVVTLGLKLVFACGQDVLFAQTTPVQNLVAFRAAATLTNASYHWDAVVSGQPQVATTARSPLPATTLTTVSWDPLLPELFQEKVIDSLPVQCTLVATFTGAFDTWTAPAETVTELTYSQAGTTNFIMPFVTWGGDLREYLRTTYFTADSIPAPALVQTRIQQALGLAPTETTTHGLAFFWVPLVNLARPAYSADIATQLPTPLPTFSDGSYQGLDGSGPVGFTYLDIADSTVTYSTLSEYVEWNQAQTTYPWTAMGYTFNWNSLQDGFDPSYGVDPLAPALSFGVSEFIVSAGSKIVNERFVTHADLGAWAVPEPALLGSGILVVAVCMIRRPRPAREGHPRRGREKVSGTFSPKKPRKRFLTPFYPRGRRPGWLRPREVSP